MHQNCGCACYIGLSNILQWNLSCEATFFAPEMWPFKRGGFSQGVDVNKFMFILTLSNGISRGSVFCQGGLSREVSLYCARKILVLIVCYSSCAYKKPSTF